MFCIGTRRLRLEEGEEEEEEEGVSTLCLQTRPGGSVVLMRRLQDPVEKMMPLSFGLVASGVNMDVDVDVDGSR